MKKRVISLFLTLAMASSMMTFASAAELKDVSGSWCEEYVTDLVDRGIVSGYSDGTYRAGTPVTRGAIAKMVFVSMQDAGSTIQEFTSNDPFTDMKDNLFEKYVVPLTQIGVIVPSEYNNKYSAGTAMSRLDTAKMLVRVYLHAHPDESLPENAVLDFTDASQISEANAPYVAFAVEKGIINGYSDGSFKPSNSINRGTAAAMISRFLDQVGTISDTIMGEAGDNRQDSQVNQGNAAAPVVQNVEWVIKPSIKGASTAGATKFSPVSEDGMSSYWTKRDMTDQTFVDLQGNTYHYSNVVDVGNFVDGMAPAKDIASGKYGYINVAGDWVIQPQYFDARDFVKVYFKDGTNEYYALVTTVDGEDKNINASTKKIDEDYDFSTIDLEKTHGPQYDDPNLSNGYEVDGNGYTTGGLFAIDARLGGLSMRYFGICDSNGKIIVRPEAATTSSMGMKIHTAYDSAHTYDDCIVLEQRVSMNYDVVNDIYDGDTGKLIYTFASSKAAAEAYDIDYRGVDNNEYGQGLFVTSTEPPANDDGHTKQPVGYMDKYGNMVIPAVFEEATAFSNGFAWVKYNGRWGVIRLPQF